MSFCHAISGADFGSCWVVWVLLNRLGDSSESNQDESDDVCRVQVRCSRTSSPIPCTRACLFELKGCALLAGSAG
jgi:hypothetical protein